MLLSFLFETVLKNSLQSNPKLAEKLVGKNILIRLLPLKEQWKIVFNPGNDVHCYQISCEEDNLEKADLKISATSQALIAMLLRGDRTGLQLEGDVVLAQVLERCFHDMFDESSLIEQFFGHRVGESSVYPVKTLFQKGREKIKALKKDTQMAMTDYLQEDTDCLPLPSEVKEFCDSVDELKLQVDRLEAWLYSYSSAKSI
jgi:ubiquinone biosynthesis protein UbiJ